MYRTQLQLDLECLWDAAGDEGKRVCRDPAVDLGGLHAPLEQSGHHAIADRGGILFGVIDRIDAIVQVGTE